MSTHQAPPRTELLSVLPVSELFTMLSGFLDAWKEA